jgi:hypothetical protein
MTKVGRLVDLAGKILQRAGNFGHNFVAPLKFRFASIGGDFVIPSSQLGAADVQWWIENFTLAVIISPDSFLAQSETLIAESAVIARKIK